LLIIKLKPSSRDVTVPEKVGVVAAAASENCKGITDAATTIKVSKIRFP
jgi:hypothetical protein